MYKLIPGFIRRFIWNRRQSQSYFPIAMMHVDGDIGHIILTDADGKTTYTRMVERFAPGKS
jgi:hypothetical protein